MGDNELSERLKKESFELIKILGSLNVKFFKKEDGVSTVLLINPPAVFKKKRKELNLSYSGVIS